MSVSSVKRCLWGTNHPNMEETGSLENPIPSGKCDLDLNRALFSSPVLSPLATIPGHQPRIDVTDKIERPFILIAGS